ncbi:MAG: UvrD-helicase domain-containing protein [Burkholderiales bacterium]|nr:UvrD-helicase domain-containing protein [Burkholderiales bacterium]
MTYDILYYSDLNYNGLKAKFDKIVQMLQVGDFKSAEVKKLKPSNYLRAKLDDSNRILFAPLKYQNKTYLVILEIIRNHEYAKSRFLRGVSSIDEETISQSLNTDVVLDEVAQLKIVTNNKQVHFLDKFIMFDDEQSAVINYPMPLILIGSAGSGKTSLMLEKLKTLTGKILYVSLSSYLVQNTKQLYYSQHYDNEHQEVDFLSFNELLETIKIQSAKEVTVYDFLKWFSLQNKPRWLDDGRKIFEEFKGVITGSNSSVPYLSADAYFNLGIKQSIYLEHERKEVYQLFIKYLDFLHESNLYDANIISHEYARLIETKYEAVFVDEIQDFTNSQLDLVLKCLIRSANFFLCGDANQIVHPNFFSWSKLKSYFYQTEELQSRDITCLLTKNYRNTPEVIELANRVLKLKNYKFGSIDKESHFLVTSTSTNHGEVSCIDAKSDMVKILNERTSKSIKYAVLVLHEADKARAKKVLNTPLIFTPQEAKGLEYENVILFDFISSENKYIDIAKGVCHEYLTTEFIYARTKEKTDKSLEIYKFYVNSLYVVITRATKNIYLIESSPQHPFISLLNINQIQQINLQEDKSSLEDWAAEAAKLAKQGKMEQTQAIEEQILHYSKVPWEVMTVNEYQTIRTQLFANNIINKKDQIRILNYAMIYNDNETISKFKALEIKASQNLEKSYIILKDTYFADYTFRNPKLMLDKINRYGLNFRNQFNLTPLMCAAYMLNDAHVAELLQHGASLSEVDNYSRTALQIFLSILFSNLKKISADKITNLYMNLCSQDVSLQIDNKLVKIGANKIEFLFLNIILSSFNAPNGSNKINIIFNNNWIISKLNHFTDTEIISEAKIRIMYINSVLSRNEINSNYPYSRKLFKRITIGKYILNPDLQIKASDSWIRLSNLINDTVKSKI